MKKSAASFIFVAGMLLNIAVIAKAQPGKIPRIEYISGTGNRTLISKAHFWLQPKDVMTRLLQSQTPTFLCTKSGLLNLP